MTTYQIYCKVGSTDFSANLGLEIWLDDQPLFNSEHITKETPVSFEFNEDELEHELRFIMKNKDNGEWIIAITHRGNFGQAG